MSDEILSDVIVSLNTVVLERVERGAFRVIGIMPEWFEPFCASGGDDAGLIHPEASSLFLESFLEDAEDFWETHQSGELRSGPWSERTDGHRSGMLEAVVYSLKRARVLTIQKLGSGLRDSRVLLQRARENRLAFERLERTKKALQKSERQNRMLIAELEQRQANVVAVLNEVRVGALLLDREGRMVFVNQASRRILGLGGEQILGQEWTHVWPFPETTICNLKRMLACPKQARSRIVSGLELPGNRRYWMEIDVQDDPYDPERHIFFFYDLTEVQDLRRMIDDRGRPCRIVGDSESILQVIRQIDELARMDISVLIEGETGTGKELVAREIHAISKRSGKPFIAVNCAGLTESILPSQLFGHKKGAFTGATSDHQGLFEAAQGGTLFLDEVGDMPPAVQASLLRVLPEMEIMRVGESRTRRIDVRVLTATHRDLNEEVAQGRFRSDLFYRIKVAPIRLPPLRERAGDLPLLTELFLSEFREALGKPVQGFAAEAMNLLKKHSWPGNVRELKSAVEFAVIRCRGTTIQPEDLPVEVFGGCQHQPMRRLGAKLEPADTPEDEKGRLLSAIEIAGGNRTAAARLLGMSRATFYRRLAEVGVTRDPKK